MTDQAALSAEHVTAETLRKFLLVSGFDYTDCVWWRERDGDLALFVRCSDFFAWGTADVEEVTSENIDSLVATVAECEAIVGRHNAEDAFLLWCSRQRGMRPQGAYYKALDEPLRHLVDAAGPERGIDLLNPQTSEGEYRFRADVQGDNDRG